MELNVKGLCMHRYVHDFTWYREKPFRTVPGEIRVVCPRNDLIFLWNGVGAVQRILVSEGQTLYWQTLSLGKKLCVGPGHSLLMINFRDNEPLNLHLPSSFSDSGQEGDTTCFYE